MMAANRTSDFGSLNHSTQPLSAFEHGKVDQSTGYLIRRTFRAFTRSLEHRLESHNISLSMWFFLRLLWERDGPTQKELSDALGLSQPTTVSAMDGMEARGLIRRRRSREDRRKVNIFLTKTGSSLKEDLLPYAAEVNEAALHSISTSQLKQAWDLLEQMNRSLDADHERYLKKSVGRQRRQRRVT